MTTRLVVVPRKKRRRLSNGSRDELHMIEAYLHRRKSRLFFDFRSTALQGLAALSSSVAYPKGATLFLEGQPAQGVFVLWSGSVKLSTNSPDGKSLILSIAEAGEVIGLAGTISDRPHEATAEALKPLQARFIARDTLFRFLREHGDATLYIAQLMAETYHAAYEELCYLALSGTASGRVARFLIDWAHAHPSDLALTLTHSDIGERIGVARETVNRCLADFRRKQLIEVDGSSVKLTNKSALQELLKSRAADE